VDGAERGYRAAAQDDRRRLAATRGPSNSVGSQVGNFYRAWMDEAGIERRGTAPLRPYLKKIADVRSRGDLVALFATPGYIAPVGVGITPDPSDPTRYVAAAGQGGLGMPNRDYYLKEGAEYDRYRSAYRDFIIELHRLAGIPDGAAKADAIIALETQIATAHWAPSACATRPRPTIPRTASSWPRWRRSSTG
jgi:endothelin-converting enzyme/putative endopeptidase